MAQGDRTKFAALIVAAEKSKTANGGDMLRIRYSKEDRVERSSVAFGSNSLVLPSPESLAGGVYEITMEETILSGKPSDKMLIPFKLLETEEPSKYQRMSLVSFDTVISRMKQLLEGDDLLPLVSRILLENKPVLERFKTWAAASEMHHGFMGGLYEHTYMMLELASKVMEIDVSCQGLDKGVVYASTIMHDLGKIREMDCSPGKLTVYTNAGSLIGHISIADSFIVRACQSLSLNPEEGRVLQVRHCMLSHHGNKRWGSPVFPKTREAVLLHQLDMIQSRNQMAKEAVETVAVGERTKYLKSMETELFRWK